MLTVVSNIEPRQIYEGICSIKCIGANEDIVQNVQVGMWQAPPLSWHEYSMGVYFAVNVVFSDIPPIIPF